MTDAPRGHAAHPTGRASRMTAPSLLPSLPPEGELDLARIVILASRGAR